MFLDDTTDENANIADHGTPDEAPAVEAAPEVAPEEAPVAEEAA